MPWSMSCRVRSGSWARQSFSVRRSLTRNVRLVAIAAATGWASPKGISSPRGYSRWDLSRPAKATRRNCAVSSEDSSPRSTGSSSSTVAMSANRGTATSASLGRVCDIQRGADPDTGVIEQSQAFPCALRPAGECAQLGGVAQGHHTSRRSMGRGGPLVDRQEPVARQVHLVGDRAVGDEQCGDVRIEPQSADITLLGVRREVQQPACLVVGQHQPPVAVEDQDPFPDGVQYRVVVLVHPGHLGRAQAMGLPPQSPAHQCRAARGDDEGPAAPRTVRQLLVHAVLDLLDRDGTATTATTEPSGARRAPPRPRKAPGIRGKCW